MKAKFLITLIAVVAVSGISFADTGLSAKAKVDVRETNFNFGYVHAGGVVSHSYLLKSSGSDSLRILKVQPACGCTKAPLKKDVIAAGDSSEVELVFTLNNQIFGKVSKSAVVFTNDSTQASFQLQFAVDSYAHPDSLVPLTLSKGEVKFDGSAGGREAKLLVTNVSQAPLRLSSVSTAPAYFKMELPESSIQPGKSKEIKIKLADKLSVDEFKQSFTFEVDNAPATRYTIPVELVKPGQASTIQPVSGH